MRRFVDAQRHYTSGWHCAVPGVVRRMPRRPRGGLGYRTALVSRPPLPDLPINEALPALAKALAERRSVLLEAHAGRRQKHPGAALPLLGSPWLQGQKIVMLEPRRIAARAAAGHMAHLLGEPVGRSVGFRTPGSKPRLAAGQHIGSGHGGHSHEDDPGRFGPRGHRLRDLRRVP